MFMFIFLPLKKPSVAISSQRHTPTSHSPPFSLYKKSLKTAHFLDFFLHLQEPLVGTFSEMCALNSKKI